MLFSAVERHFQAEVLRYFMETWRSVPQFVWFYVKKVRHAFRTIHFCLRRRYFCQQRLLILPVVKTKNEIDVSYCQLVDIYIFILLFCQKTCFETSR